MADATVDADFQTLVAMLSAMTSALAAREDFRRATAARGDADLAHLLGDVEALMPVQLRAIRQIRAGLQAAGGVMAHFDADVARTWAKLADGHAAQPWTTPFAGMERLAGWMGLTGADAAAAPIAA